MVTPSKIIFPLSTDQLRLLLAFETAPQLSVLSKTLARDVSVISRNLQKIAEELPVIQKIDGRWTMTHLGRSINEISRKYLSEMNEAISSFSQQPKTMARTIDKDKTALIVINAQRALATRSNSSLNNSAQERIKDLLKFCRGRLKSVIHVPHISESSNSIFHRGSDGAKFLPGLEPVADTECVLEKSKSSAFFKTNLEDFLNEQEISTLVLCGFTANDCIDATARDASNLEFETIVIEDAVAMFDLKGTHGELIPAERVQELTMANLSALYAQVFSTKDFLKSL